MSEFQFKTAIPTHSDARGLLSAGNTYFSSNTHLFTLKNGKYSLVSSCDGTIKAFGVTGDYSILCTAERVYLNSHSNLVGSLRRSASAIDVCESFFAIAVDNILEVWKIPTEYKFTLFTQHSKNVGHYRTIRHIKIISRAEILTASDDCTVRLFNIERKTTKIIASLSDTPRGLHYDAASETVVVTCTNGSVTRVCLQTMEYTSLKLEGAIAASASAENIWAVALENIEKSTGVERPTPLKKPAGMVLLIFKDMDEIYRGEMDQRVIEMAMDRNSVIVRTQEGVASYSIHAQSFEFQLDLPTILGISVFKNTVAASCKDRKIRIYRGLACVATLSDASATGDIVGVHLSSNICIAVYSTGHVSSFNVSDTHCFRSFRISDDPLGILSHSCMSEDGCLLYVSQLASIQAIDIVRSKLVDTINLKSPVVGMAFYRGLLYAVELDRTLSKINIFSGHSDSVMVENTPTSLVVKDQRVAVSTVMDVLIYDLDINFINSFQARLEGRRRDEMFSKGKAVEQIDFNSRYIFCGGAANQIKVFEQHKDHTLMKNFLFQAFRVSSNKDWENYKIKLMKEREDRVDKERVISTLRICADEHAVYVLGTDGLRIYEKAALRFSPLEFDVIASEEYVRDALGKGSHHKALMGAMRMGSAELIKAVISECKDQDFLVRHIPGHYAEILVDMLVEWLKEDFTRLEYIALTTKLVKWHGMTRSGLSKEIQEGTRQMYDETRRCKYLVDVVFNRGK